MVYARLVSTAGKAAVVTALAAVTVLAFQDAAQPPQPLSVTAVRFWSLEDATRVVIEASGEFQFRRDWLRNPDRLYFDIVGAKPSPQQGTHPHDCGGRRVYQTNPRLGNAAQRHPGGPGSGAAGGFQRGPARQPRPAGGRIEAPGQASRREPPAASRRSSGGSSQTVAAATGRPVRAARQARADGGEVAGAGFGIEVGPRGPGPRPRRPRYRQHRPVRLAREGRGPGRGSAARDAHRGAHGSGGGLHPARRLLRSARSSAPPWPTRSRPTCFCPYTPTPAPLR